MQNNVKINFTIISALVFVILSLTNNQKVFCQEYDEVQIFKEMPDSLRKHSTDWMGDYFNSDVRHRIFQEKFTEGGLNSFGVEEYELFEMDPPEPDDVLMPPSYSVEINPKLSCINLMYFSNFYIVSLDFCFFSENKSYSILLFESYGEYYYSDSEYAISKYYFDKKTKTYIE
jgi:hypothetical protein